MYIALEKRSISIFSNSFTSTRVLKIYNIHSSCILMRDTFIIRMISSRPKFLKLNLSEFSDIPKLDRLPHETATLKLRMNFIFEINLRCENLQEETALIRKVRKES